MKALESKANTKSIASVSPSELRVLLNQKDDVQLLDVREYPEYAAGHIHNSRLIPLNDLEQRRGEIDANKRLVCICRSGKRAAQAAEKLSGLGLANVARLEGGLTAWEQAGLPLKRDERAPWALERQVRFAAGLLVLLGLALSFLWSPAIVLSWFVGIGLVFAAVTDWCGMGLLLAKAPWNRRAASCANNCRH